MKTCLIVDDSKIIRLMARKILEEFGFSTEEATDGQEALNACKRSLPDVALVDWRMPVMDGLEFLKELRALPGGEATIVVFLTAKNDMENIEEAIEAGANEYIMKPFDAEIIQSKLMLVGLL
jgi:two-component system chemotaxis response regulator CheY